MELEYKKRWENCLRFIRDNLDKEQYEAWFAPIMVKDYAEGVLTLQVPSAFYAEQLESKYLQLLSVALRREFVGVKRLRYAHNIIEGDADTTAPHRFANKFQIHSTTKNMLRSTRNSSRPTLSTTIAKAAATNLHTPLPAQLPTIRKNRHSTRCLSSDRPAWAKRTLYKPSAIV